MRELLVDSFAGGGGASLGVELALGKSPDIAINHDQNAIKMHAANHPGTKHYTEDVWKVSPRKVTGGKPVGLLWASPDCKHFSRAKGGKPVSKQIRSLAWVVVKWAAESRPRIIILENVREFAEWGPLVPMWECKGCGWKGTEGQGKLGRSRRRCPRCESLRLTETISLIPDPSRKGLTFKRFVGRLKAMGYAVEWKNMDAANYGAPTHRRRLFLVARCDGQPIVWPEPTHGDPKKLDEPDLFGPARQPWRTAAECIDWDLPCPSIFSRKRPLAEKTMKRIAEGIRRYVLENPKPFIVCCNHGGAEFRGQDLGRPLPTLTAARDAHGLVTPFLARICQGGGNGKYVNSAAEPLTTIVSKNEHLLVSAFLAKHYGGVVGHGLERPIGTVTSRDHHSLVAANLVHLNNGSAWSGCDEPMRTVTSGGNHAALVYAFLAKYFGTAIGQSLDAPLGTQTTKDRYTLVTVQVNGETFAIVDIGMRMLTPRELARGQGFGDDYVLTGTNTSQVARIGNSVPPVMAKVLVEANYEPAAVAV